MLQPAFVVPARNTDEPSYVQEIINEQSKLRAHPDQEALNILLDQHFPMVSNYPRAVTEIAQTVSSFCDAYERNNTLLNLRALHKLIVNIEMGMGFFLNLDREVAADYNKPEHPWHNIHSRFMDFIASHGRKLERMPVTPLRPGFPEHYG